MTLNQYKILVRKAIEQDIKNGVAQQMFDEQWQHKHPNVRSAFVLSDLIEINKQKVYEDIDIFVRVDLLGPDGFGLPPLDKKHRDKLHDLLRKKIRR